MIPSVDFELHIPQIFVDIKFSAHRSLTFIGYAPYQNIGKPNNLKGGAIKQKVLNRIILIG